MEKGEKYENFIFPDGIAEKPTCGAKDVDAEKADNQKQIRSLADQLKVLKNREVSQTKLYREVRDLWVMTGAYLASNGLLYKRFEDDISFVEAQKQCEKIGARLASTGIRNATIQEELWEHVLEKQQSNTWIGLHEPHNNGTWIWSDGWEYVLRETPWGGGQPNNHDGDEDCARIWDRDDGFHLGDMRCAEPYAYLCEKNI